MSSAAIISLLKPKDKKFVISSHCSCLRGLCGALAVFLFVEYCRYITACSCFTSVICLAELYKMVCDPEETDLDIHIPAVMLPQDAGATLDKMLLNRSSGKFLRRVTT